MDHPPGPKGGGMVQQKLVHRDWYLARKVNERYTFHYICAQSVLTKMSIVYGFMQMFNTVSQNNLTYNVRMAHVHLHIPFMVTLQYSCGLFSHNNFNSVSVMLTNFQVITKYSF